MADIFDFTGGQDQSRAQFVPVVFRWLEDFGIGSADQPGQWTPFLAGPSGAVYVQQAAGDTLTPLQILDLTENAYDPTSGDIGPVGISLTWAWDDDEEQYVRLNAIREPSTWTERALATAAGLYRYNGVIGGFQENEGNDQRQVLGSAARTTETTSNSFNNLNWRGAHFIVNVTAIVATPSITVNIEAQDNVSSVWYPILISDPITSTGTTVLKVGPGYTPIANLTANDNLPYRWRVRVEHADTDSITYSIGANLFVQ